MGSQAQRPSFAVRNGALATINVGSDFTVYRVHRKLLVKHSEYFARALKESWRNAQDSVTRLEDVDSDTFNIFVDWLYTQKLPKKAIDWISDDEQLACGTDSYAEDTFMAGEVSRRAKQLQQAKAYVFGDRFSSPKFKQAVYKTYLDELGDPNALPYYHIVAYAFANLPEGDPLLRFMVDAHCHNFGKETDTPTEVEDRKQLPHEFLVRVMLRYSNLVAKYDQETLDARDYQLGGKQVEERTAGLITEADEDTDTDIDSETDEDGEVDYFN